MRKISCVLTGYKEDNPIFFTGYEEDWGAGRGTFNGVSGAVE